LLTPVLANSILETKREVDQNKLQFWQSEFRTMNFFNVKTSMSETKQIKKPEDLYQLSFDESSNELISQKLFELSERKLTADEVKMLKF
jgi:hypothetical protein